MFVLYEKKSGEIVSYHETDIFSKTKSDIGKDRLVVNREWPPVSPSPVGKEYIINVLDPTGNPLEKKTHDYVELEFADGKEYKVDLNHPEDKPEPAKLEAVI